MKKIFRIIFTLIIIYLTNHSFAFSQNEKIKIGLLAPLSGEYKELGQSIIKSTRMALSDIGTDNIEIYPMDTGIDPNQTLQSAAKLKNEGIKIFIRFLMLISELFKYAKKILRCLGIEDLFLDIFDITKSNYIPKPMKSSLNKLIKQYELNPLETAYFDDLEKNLMSASLKGFTTIHISEKSSSESQSYIDFRFKTVINALDMISKVL